MKTYIFTNSRSTKRAFTVCITVYRIKKNTPVYVGHADHHTGCWCGGRAAACEIIHNADGIPYATRKDGTPYRYALKGMLGYAELDTTTSGDGIRLFTV